MKKISIGVAAAVIIAIIAWFVLVSRRGTTPAVSGASNETADSHSLSPVYHIPTSTTILIGTPRGSVVVDNFYKTAAGAEERFIVLVRNDNYEIAYDAENSGFSLNIKQAPFDDNRASAEADFLKILGVSRADACKLYVAESFPRSSALGGLRPGLSFCSGGAFQAK